MTTENQLITYVPTRVVNIFLVICPMEGGSVKKSDNLSPSEKNIHSRITAKISKPPLSRALALYIYPSTLLCLGDRQLDLSITFQRELTLQSTLNGTKWFSLG